MGFNTVGLFSSCVNLGNVLNLSDSISSPLRRVTLTAAALEHSDGVHGLESDRLGSDASSDTGAESLSFSEPQLLHTYNPENRRVM